MRPEQRGWAKRLSSTSNWQQEETLAATKPFDIPKLWVAKAFQAVKANGGAAGGDGVSLEVFERSLEDNLYKLWNRMASGSYVPPPVKAAIIPKKDGGERVLGVPTGADRVAQMGVKMAFEPNVEPVFLADSYGYRPGKSALDAVRVTRERCWKYNWVLEFDIKGLFENIPQFGVCESRIVVSNYAIQGSATRVTACHATRSKAEHLLANLRRSTM